MTTWHRPAAYALLRVALGIVLFFAGVGKLLGGIGAFESGLLEQFSETLLPLEMVSWFAHALPFVEVTLGGLLLVGLFTPLALLGAGSLLLVLTFGTVVSGAPEVAHNVFYAAVAALLLWMVNDANAYSLDRLRKHTEPARAPAGIPPAPGIPVPPPRGWSKQRPPSRRPPARTDAQRGGAGATRREP